jgi:hypothetical protein
MSQCAPYTTIIIFKNVQKIASLKNWRRSEDCKSTLITLSFTIEAKLRWQYRFKRWDFSMVHIGLSSGEKKIKKSEQNVQVCTKRVLK